MDTLRSFNVPVSTEAVEIINIEKISELPSKPIYCLVKRILDILLSFFALLFLAIPMLIIATLIRIDSNGPSIYKQERLGKNGKPFMIYKFRSMVNGAEMHGPRWAEEDDERVTNIGRFLRKTRLDELPQLFNIIAGQMSIVGPRPERAHFYKQFSSYINGFEQRLLVKPGLTGWAQVNGGYNLKPEEKILFDVDYMKKRSMLLDFKCIFLTVRILFSQNGAR